MTHEWEVIFNPFTVKHYSTDDCTELKEINNQAFEKTDKKLPREIISHYATFEPKYPALSWMDKFSNDWIMFCQEKLSK